MSSSHNQQLVYTVVEQSPDLKTITTIVTCTSLNTAKLYLTTPARKILNPCVLIDEKITNNSCPLFKIEPYFD